MLPRCLLRYPAPLQGRKNDEKRCPQAVLQKLVSNEGCVSSEHPQTLFLASRSRTERFSHTVITLTIWYLGATETPSAGKTGFFIRRYPKTPGGGKSRRFGSRQLALHRRPDRLQCRLDEAGHLGLERPPKVCGLCIRVIIQTLLCKVDHSKPPAGRIRRTRTETEVRRSR